MDVGLVICPYGPAMEIGDGILVPGDGGAHHQVLFQVVVFKPFIDEILVGTVTESKEEGVMVSVGGFFTHVFIPAYWMLNPSTFDEGSGLWVWTPNYDEEEHEGDGTGDGAIKQEEGEYSGSARTTTAATATTEGGDEEEEVVEQNRFEIEIGAEIRFKVKAVNFTRITTTMKGVQATTTSTTATSYPTTSSERPSLEMNGSNGSSAKSSSQLGINQHNNNSNSNNNFANNEIENENKNGMDRKRGSSADKTNSDHHPVPMQILGSICEDGLGLTIWWKDEAEGEEGEDE